jgi:hypothetical protein
MLIGGHFFKDILQTERISFDTTFVVGHDGTDHCGTNLMFLDTTPLGMTQVTLGSSIDCLAF